MPLPRDRLHPAHPGLRRQRMDRSQRDPNRRRQTDRCRPTAADLRRYPGSPNRRRPPGSSPRHRTSQILCCPAARAQNHLHPTAATPSRHPACEKLPVESETPSGNAGTCPACLPPNPPRAPPCDTRGTRTESIANQLPPHLAPPSTSPTAWRHRPQESTEPRRTVGISPSCPRSPRGRSTACRMNHRRTGWDPTRSPARPGWHPLHHRPSRRPSCRFSCRPTPRGSELSSNTGDIAPSSPPLHPERASACHSPGK